MVRSGTQGLVILRQENQKRHANLSVRLGAVIELATSCSGQVLLAHLDSAEREQLLQTIPRPRGVSRAKVAASLEKVRKRGYEIHPSPITAGVTDLSYPVRGFDGKVIAALTIPYLHALDNSLPTNVEKTRQAARRSDPPDIAIAGMDALRREFGYFFLNRRAAKSLRFRRHVCHS